MEESQSQNLTKPSSSKQLHEIEAGWYWGFSYSQARGETGRALDILYSKLTEKLKKGEFEDIDVFLAIYPIHLIDDNGILCILTLTKCAKDKIPNREEFFNKAEAHFSSKLDNEQVVRDILYGLD